MDWASPSLEPESQVDFSVGAIGLRKLKPGALVHGQRLTHRGHRVAYKLRVTSGSGFGNHPFKQRPADATPAKLRTNIEPFGFGTGIIEPAESHASGSKAVHEGNRETTVRRSICARQPSQFRGEILKARLPVSRLMIPCSFGINLREPRGP